jgi:hypothetical protein
MKDISDLETGSVIKHQVPAYDYVHIVRRRWWKHHLQLARARLHSSADLHRQHLIHNKPPFQTRRQPVALGKPGWEMVVVRPVPTSDITVVIHIMLVSVMVSVVMVVAIVIVVVVVPTVVVIVLVMTVAISLCDGKTRGESHA